MKIIRHLGLILFCFTFLLFISVLFLNNYSLTNEVINSLELNTEQNKLFKEHAVDVLGRKYKSKYAYIKSIKKVIHSVNNNLIQKYSITNSEIEKIVKLCNSKYSGIFQKSVIDSVYLNSSKVNDFKRTTLKAYTEWMVNKKFDNNAELLNNLKKTASNINVSIIGSKGFDDYHIKTLEFEIVKQSSKGIVTSHRVLFVYLIFILGIAGALIYIIPTFKSGFPGIKNNHIFFTSLNTRGIIGIILGSLLITFYIILYWYPAYIVEWVILINPLSVFLNGHNASSWFLYGFLYTLAILVMGTRFIIKYRHSKYHLIRTISVMFFQLCFAFILSNILALLNLPEVDLKNIWPLDYSFFFEWRINQYLQSGTLGYFMFGWGIVLFLIIVPLFTYFYGKRWYCSWVCGCGGLAETAGDPFRQLSDKSVKAWKIERKLIYAVLIFALVMTVLVLYTFFTGKSHFLGLNSYSIRSVYGFLISSIFAGVVGTGFYPLFGNRVWCRFGCPLAAYMGIIQRFKSRFRITTNGSQCISCGNCSTYCEMGIDVRWYAQRGQNIVRASCVGCGVCSSVCPRGVLRLENGPEKSRINETPVF
ncbi:MAG: 4Fe-4S binding protein [Chlorobi bacterium]|nr:4Fe-4S binding protein [Chlorobiota bacterium]